MNRKTVFIGGGILVLVMIVAASILYFSKERQETKTGINHFEVSSSFKEGEVIPVKFTCDGKDISPSIAWSGLQQETQSIVLILEDQDAPTGVFIHWILYDISPQLTGLAEGIEKSPQILGVGYHGLNSFGRVEYSGPCPPEGAPHRYIFKLYALDTRLNIDAGANSKKVSSAMQGHILAQGELTGLYGK